MCFLERFIYLLVYLFLAVLGLYSCSWALSSHSRWGLHFIVVLWLLIAVASLHCKARTLGRQASVAVAQRLSCSATCGIFLHQGLNLCPLHWQADSQSLDRQGGPQYNIFYLKISTLKDFSITLLLWLRFRIPTEGL